MIRRILLFVFLSLVSFPCAFCDPIDDFILSQMQKQKIPGLALSVLQNGEVVRAKCYGFANLEHQVPVIPETVFQSGSVGKQFTATGIMMLVEQGKMHLDDPVSVYIKDAPASWKDITIRNLLTHTSGIPDYTDQKDFDYRRDYTEDQLLKIIESYPLEFRPGESWNYSNSGYMLLGILIHKVYGKFYGELLKERIFQPLGMTSTRVMNEADIIPHRAAGYELVEKEVKNQQWVSPLLNTTADGALYLSIADMAKWDAALYGEKLIKKTTLNQMWTPVKLKNGVDYPYGFGWEFDYQRGHKVIEHSGHWQGFSAGISRYVDDHLTVILLSNMGGVTTLAITHAVAGLYEPALQTARFMKPKPDDDPARAVRLKSALSDLAKGVKSSPAIASAYPNFMSKDDRDELAGQIKDIRAFDYLDCDDVSTRKIERYGSLVDRNCYYKISSQAGIFYATFALTKDGRLIEYSLVGD